MLLKIIAALSVVPILASVVLTALLYAKLCNVLKTFSWFIFLSGATQVLALCLGLAGVRNMLVLHIYVPGGFVCLSWFYKTVLGDFINAKILWGAAVLFVLFSIGNSLFVQHFSRFNSNALVVESILVIILSLFAFMFFLNGTMKETGIADLKSLTWINSGLFIYYLSCLLIFYFGDTILFSFTKDLSRFTWMFHAFFSTVMYSCFIVGLWKHSRTPNL